MDYIFEQNNNVKSIYEQNIDSKNDKIEEFEKSSIASEITNAFPDAKLINIIDED